MEAFIVFYVDHDKRDHNNLAQLDGAHCRHGISIPGSNCLFGRIKFIQYCHIIYHRCYLWGTDRFNFLEHYHCKCYSKLDRGIWCGDV